MVFPPGKHTHQGLPDFLLIWLFTHMLSHYISPQWPDCSNGFSPQGGSRDRPLLLFLSAHLLPSYLFMLCSLSPPTASLQLLKLHLTSLVFFISSPFPRLSFSSVFIPPSFTPSYLPAVLFHPPPSIPSLHVYSSPPLFLVVVFPVPPLFSPRL